MVAPRHKVREVKKKTIFDKLKQSAIFILLMVALAASGMVALIFWISKVLQGSLQGWDMVKDIGFFIWVGLTVFFVVFFTFAWFVQRRVHGA